MNRIPPNQQRIVRGRFHKVHRPVHLGHYLHFLHADGRRCFRPSTSSGCDVLQQAGGDEGQAGRSTARVGSTCDEKREGTRPYVLLTALLGSISLTQVLYMQRRKMPILPHNLQMSERRHYEPTYVARCFDADEWDASTPKVHYVFYENCSSAILLSSVP